jgi:hypothetical protein
MPGDAFRVYVEKVLVPTPHPGRDQTVAARAAREGCGLPMTPRGLADEPLSREAIQSSSTTLLVTKSPVCVKRSRQSVRGSYTCRPILQI